jgi:hypothetical protein
MEGGTGAPETLPLGCNIVLRGSVLGACWVLRGFIAAGTISAGIGAVVALDAFLVFLSWWLGGPYRAAKRSEGAEPEFSWHFNGLLILAAGFLARDVWMLMKTF